MKRRIAAVVASALLLGLGACSTKAGAAAIVGDTRITEAQVAALVKEAQATERRLKKPITPAAQSSSSALSWQVRMLIVDAAAKKADVQVTNSEIEDVVNKTYQQYGKDEVLLQLASNGFPETEISKYARLTLLQGKVSQIVLDGGTDQAAQTRLAQFWQSLAASLKIEIAPRFGTWNNDILGIDPPTSKVSTPASTPEPQQ